MPIVREFFKTGQIVDSKEVGKNLKVYMKFNSPERDREGDLFLKSAWVNEEDNSEFARKGWYDYNHLSVIKPKSTMTPEQIAKSELARLQAIIGKPDSDPRKAIYWSDVENGPVTEGILDGENEYVKTMKSLMKSGYVFEASAAGGVYEPNEKTVLEQGDKTWDRARIQHIAICPATEAINPETYVMLKSVIASEMGIIKRNENMVETIQKSKPNALQEFVLASPEYAKHVFNGIVAEIKKGSMPVKYETMKSYLMDREIPEDDATECAELLIIKFKGL